MKRITLKWRAKELRLLRDLELADRQVNPRQNCPKSFRQQEALWALESHRIHGGVKRGE